MRLARHCGACRPMGASPCPAGDAENGVAKRFNIAHMQPENTYALLPASRAAIDAAAAYLARCG